MIQVLQTGIQSSIQDLGRWGFQSYGISIGGSLCHYSASVANLLVGNPVDAPVLEMTQAAHQFLIAADCLVAFSGGGLIPTINENELALNQPHFLKAGTLVDLRKPSPGFRLYMAVERGFKANLFLNSYSTHFGSQSGGFKGRAIEKGDLLAFREEQNSLAENIKNSLQKYSYFVINAKHFAIRPSKTLRITVGAEFDLLEKDSQKKLKTSTFSITNNSDRMGYRLKGPLLIMNNGSEMISSAVSKGTIQLLPDGQLIALMPDCQTVGGYPKIAHIIESDFTHCAQLKPGDSISFQMVTLNEAEQLMEQQNAKIQLLKTLIEQNFS